MARPEQIQQLDRQVAAAVERALRGMREQFGGRLRQASEELLKLLQEASPDVPQSYIHEDDLSPIIAAARAEGRSEGLRELRAGFVRIDRADTQAAALEALLQTATLFASRAALFLTRPDGAHGWAGFGFGESAGTIASLEISYADAPWGELARGRGGVELDAAACARLCSRIEVSAPRSGVLIPLVLRDQVAAALYADRLTDSSRLDLEALQVLTQSAALAIETLPFRQRSLTPTLHLADPELPALQLWQPEAGPTPAAAEPEAMWSEPELEPETLFGDPVPEAPLAPAGFSFDAPSAPAAEGALSWSAFTPEPVAEELPAPDMEPIALAPEGDLGAPETVSAYEPSTFEAPAFDEPFIPLAPEAPAVPIATEPAVPPSEVLEEQVSEEVWVLDDTAAPPSSADEVAAFVSGYELPEPPAPAPPVAARPAPVGPASAPSESTAAIDVSEDSTLLLERPRRPEAVAPQPSTQEMHMQQVEDDTHPGFSRKLDTPAAAPAKSGTWQPGITSEVQPPADLAGPGWAFATTRVAAAVSAPAEESLHEEARRLARLLVSEIKLYNEEQVEEGRRARAIYERLKEDIDRSRQMYEERVDERVRNKTDYFYQELVRILAAGDAKALGI